MDFKQLESFVNVVELCSFSKAAEAIFLSQPSVSNYIKELEKELGSKLLYRTTKEVVPTKAGKVMYEYAKNMLSLRQNAIHELNSLPDSLSGELEVMASSVPYQYILSKIAAQFTKQYPGVVFKMNQADTHEVINKIAARDCEIGAVGAALSNTKCEFNYFFTDRLVIITPYEEKYQRLASEGSLDFLRDERFIMREKGSGTRLEFEKFLNSIGISTSSLSLSAIFGDTMSIIQAVSQGMGISIVSQMAAESYIENKKALAIAHESPLLNRDCYFVYRKDAQLQPLTRAFISFASGYFKKNAAE